MRDSPSPPHPCPPRLWVPERCVKKQKIMFSEGLTSPPGMSPNQRPLFSATCGTSPASPTPSTSSCSLCGEDGCLQCVSPPPPPRAVCSTSWLFGGGAEGSRPVVILAVCTQMASFQNHATDRMKNTTLEQKSVGTKRSFHRGTEGQCGAEGASRWCLGSFDD